MSRCLVDPVDMDDQLLAPAIGIVFVFFYDAYGATFLGGKTNKDDIAAFGLLQRILSLVSVPSGIHVVILVEGKGFLQGPGLLPIVCLVVVDTGADLEESGLLRDKGLFA